MKARSTYSNEFKIDTANLVLKQGYSIQEAADAMNVGPTAVRRWSPKPQVLHLKIKLLQQSKLEYKNSKLVLKK